MKNYFLMMLTAVGLLAAWPVQALDPNAPPGLQRLFENEEERKKMSGAAQTVLERLFATKEHLKPAVAVAPGLAQNPHQPTTGTVLTYPGTITTSPLATPPVNNATADATSQDTQSETTLALGAGGNVIAAFNDSGSYLAGASKFTGFARSANSGTSWTDGGTLPTNPNGDAGDPVLARDNTLGRTYLCTLAFSGSGERVFRSNDDGVSWLAPVEGAPGFGGGDFLDKEWLTVDNFTGAGQGNVYLAFRNFAGGAAGSQPEGIYLFRSTDGGATFSPAGGTIASSLIAGPGLYNVQGAWVTVGPDHAVYVFWLDQSAGGGTPNIVKLRKSTNQGSSFATAVTVATLNETGVNGDLGLNGGFRSSCFAQALVNPVSGHLYVVYPDDPAGLDAADVYFRMSTDGGNTWSSAVRVNDDVTTTDQFMPALAVKPDGTGLMVAWYDRRRDASNYLIERWGSVATIVGSTVTFGHNFRIGDQFPVVIGQDPVINASYMGDYDQIVADNSYYYATWSDNRSGNAFHAHQPDVRFARIPVAGPGVILDFVSATLTGGNGNGLFDPNECNELAVTVQNNGSAAATGIDATLSTGTASVSVTQPTAAYPDLSPGGLGVNLTAFQVSTAPAFLCGTVLDFTLTLAHASGTDIINFSKTTGITDYVIATSTGAAIVPGTTDVGNHCDDCTTVISLPFTFPLYGQNFNSVTLSSNGNLEFGPANTAYANSCLPAAGFTATIFAHWDDLLTTAAGGGIFTSVSGSAPNRIFNIEWRTVLYASSTTAVNFEIRLYENQDRFDVIYGNIGGAGGSATVGVQKDTTAFTAYGCNAGNLTSGLQLTFTLPNCSSGPGECSTVNCNPDTQPPLITCPGATSVVANASCQAALPDVLSRVIASDTCSAVNLAQLPAAGTTVGIGATSVKVTATDQAGNSNSCTTTVNVLDTVRPTINCPANITTPAAAGLCSAVVTYTVTAADNCSSVTVSSTPPSGSSFPRGTTTVNSVATDGSGNQTNCSFTVTVVDTQPPSITCPANVTKSTTKCAVNVSYPAPTATDNCGVASIVSTPASGSSFPIGTNTVTSVATDTSGNTATCTFKVIVKKSGGKPCR